MQQFYDDIDVTQEDREYLERREKRRQRRLEEQRKRQKRLKMMKIFLGVGTVSVVALCITIAGISETKGSAKNPEAGIIEEENLQLGDAQEQLEDESQIAESETAVTETVSEQKPDTTPKKEPVLAYIQPIEFNETADTKGIYSEEVISEYAVLIDADAGTVVAKKNAYDKMIPASMTKVLTLLVASDIIGYEDLDDTFTMTLEITDYAYKNDCSSVGFLDQEVVTVRDLLYGTVLASGGDAAVGLATYVAGSHEKFIELMNEKVKQLGLSDSAHFTNSVGIYDKELYCTVYDMAVIMKAAMQSELCREVLKARTYTTSFTTEHPEGITISNWFMRRIEDKDSGGEVLGAKTGYVAQSGSCAVSYQEDANGKTYICVTGKSTSSWRCIYDHVEIYNTYVPE